MLKKAVKICLLFHASLILTVSAYAENNTLASKEMLSYTCAGCHGPNGTSVGPATPTIGGQSKNYLISVLLGYKYYAQPDELEKIMEQKEFEDFEIFPRYSIIMSRLMAGYSVEEIKLIAEYFSEQKWHRAKQQTDTTMADSGAKLHESACEKCHEDGGTSAVDDISILAGQWMPYLQHTINDYQEKRSGMPKKMKQKMETVHEKYGDSGFQKLIHFYSQH